MDSSTTHESSPSSKNWKYDVFLSFRGEDTRKGFTDNLLYALRGHRLKVFVDKEMKRGETIGEELKREIQQSRMAAIVFSTGYADSTWCLDELATIMDCRKKLGQMVLPIFYDVDPTNVRKQTGSFEEAFQKHEERFRLDIQKVQRWRAACAEAANVSGASLKNTDGYEGKFIRKIVSDMDRKLNNTYLHVAEHQIGIESRVQEISYDLRIGGSDAVRIIGILGFGGTGKTTLAKAVFNRYLHKFDAKSFLSNVRERNVVELQNQLLYDILRPVKTEVSSVDEGTMEIKKRLGSMKVLIIIDDVDSVQQLDRLAINHRWFGRGSRIIITTRNNNLLNAVAVDKRCFPQLLNKEEALQLFSWRAFSKSYPNEGYSQLSTEIVDYCRGVPLALEVLGSSLCKKSKREWRSALDKLRRYPPGQVHENLRISYDGLTDDDVRAIFLDISCFFVGMNKDYAMTILDGCDLYAEIGIGELNERCLLTVDNEGNLMMHNLIQDMGKAIVHAESPSTPGRRSRLWHHDDVKGVLKNHSGTEEIKGLTLELLESHKSSFSTEAFRNMQGLRLLKLKGAKFAGCCEHLSKELRWLCWPGFPLEVIPEDFNQPNLVDIDLSHSDIQVWEDSDVVQYKLNQILSSFLQCLEKLKFLNLGSCNSLKQLPDFSKIPNLVKLILAYCTSLGKVHRSVGQLKNLKYLYLTNCNLTDGDVPEDLGGLSSLEVLDLRGNGFIGFPILSGLSKLQTLKLDKCINLGAISDLPKKLEILEADECIALEKMPDFSEMSSMRELHLNHSPKLSEIPGFDKSLNSMTKVHMERCSNLTATFKESIIRGWSGDVDGGLFLPGNDFPSWFTLVDPNGEIVVPQSCSCDLKALPVCIMYSSDDSQSVDSLCIRVANGTQNTQFLIGPIYATAMTRDEDQLWLGHLSNSKLNVKGGDRIVVGAHFVGPGSTDDVHLRVNKIGVNLEGKVLVKEDTLHCESMPCSSEYDEDSNHKAAPGDGSPDVYRLRKRSRADRCIESNAEEEFHAGNDGRDGFTNCFHGGQHIKPLDFFFKKYS